jgi:hypothetical protein
MPEPLNTLQKNNRQEDKADHGRDGAEGEQLHEIAPHFFMRFEIMRFEIMGFEIVAIGHAYLLENP